MKAKVGEHEMADCGCVVVVTSSGWCCTVERCYVHGDDPDLSDEYPNLTAQLRLAYANGDR